MKALVLNSGGVDSTTCAGIAVDKYGKEKQCGKCGTCIDRKKAFKLNGVEDSVEYEV